MDTSINPDITDRLAKCTICVVRNDVEATFAFDLAGEDTLVFEAPCGAAFVLAEGDADKLESLAEALGLALIDGLEYMESVIHPDPEPAPWRVSVLPIGSRAGHFGFSTKDDALSAYGALMTVQEGSRSGLHGFSAFESIALFQWTDDGYKERKVAKKS